MRDKRIDFIKGMLMLCVVYGHTINALLGGTHHSPIWLHVFVRTFDMPFFMILSGYFLKRSLEKRTAINVALNRFSMILLPIAIWTLVRGHITCSMYYFLWAVLASSLICVIVRQASSLLPRWSANAFELILYSCVSILFYVARVPWNMFYLFPFFVLGYCLRDVRFELSRQKYAFLSIVFIGALCFWKPSYTPWSMGAFAWKDDHWAVVIYAYRFGLGIVGVVVVSKVFELIRSLCDENSFIVRTITECGSETLALYILQSIVIERLMGMVCDVAYTHYPVELQQSVVNLVGYVIAPMMSFVSTVGLLYVIRYMKRTFLLKYAFGFKIK